MAHFADCAGLGSIEGLKELAGTNAAIGQQVVAGGKKGRAQRDARNVAKIEFTKDIQSRCKKLKEKNSALGITEIRKRVAKELTLSGKNASEKTIQRHTQDWKTWLFN